MDSMETATATGTSSSKLILSVIAILVVVGIGYAFFGNKADDGGALNDDGTFSGTMFDLAKRGGSLKCTWDSAQDGVTMSGTVYVDRGKFKSDAEVTASGMNVIAHTIGDGDFVYSWTNLMPTGFKFPMTEGAAGVPPQGTNAQAEQFSSMYDYTCESWTAESGTFALPSGITFTEMTVPQQ